VLVKQLSVYSKELRSLERASLVADAQRMSENLRADQEREQKEIEEQIVEEARCLDNFRARYQNLTETFKDPRLSPRTRKA